MLKKLLIKDKGCKILIESPIILIYQYNSVSTKNVSLLKNECSKIQGVSSLVIRNKIAQKVLEKIQHGGVVEKKFYLVSSNSNFSQKYTPNEKMNNLFQGPTFLLSCQLIDQLIPIKNLMKNSPNFLFVGGLYNNQTISHYTLEKLVYLANSGLTLSHETKQDSFDYIIIELIQLLENKLSSILFLKNQLNCCIFNLINVCNKNRLEKSADHEKGSTKLLTLLK